MVRGNKVTKCERSYYKILALRSLRCDYKFRERDKQREINTMISINVIRKTLKSICEQGVDVNCFFFRKSNQEGSDDWGDSFLHCISIKEKECGKVNVNCESLDLVATI